MEAIAITILTGVFSLAGIWYQNYLSKKSNGAVQPVQQDHKGGIPEIQQPISVPSPQQNSRNTRRIVFTILIAVSPWLVFDYALRMLWQLSHANGNSYQADIENLLMTRNRIILYCGIWVIITVVALLSGWARKTIFEKFILIASALILIYIGCLRYTEYSRNINSETNKSRDTSGHR